MKTRIVIYGTGKSADLMLQTLKSEQMEIVSYLDGNLNRWGQYKNNVLISAPEKIKTIEFDYLILATVHDTMVLKQFQYYQVDVNKIIPFFRYEKEKWENFGKWMDLEKAEAFIREQLLYTRIEELEKRQNKLLNYIRNVEYEIAGKIQTGKYEFPQIMSYEEMFQQIELEKKSICRFGDGEFSCIAGKNRARFQENNSELAKRLKEVLNTRNSQIMISLADNYGSLDHYTDEAADNIRYYLTPQIRSQHMALLDMNYVYGNAYITRCYMIYKDKSKAEGVFKRFRKIWAGRKVLLVEGEKTRFGYHNDLLSTAQCVKRILCPSENAYGKYEDILKEIKKYSKEHLVLAALGPTATVLAYDLAELGYQALDIGHLDIEYEWFLAGEHEMVNIPFKYVNDCQFGNAVDDIKSSEYEGQIVADLSK